MNFETSNSNAFTGQSAPRKADLALGQSGEAFTPRDELDDEPISIAQGSEDALT
jgi:hypothetical protein